MQPEQLRTLIAIRDAGSLSAAAQSVHLSHSAVSLQMKRLEETLGRAVLHKGRRPACLTPFGQTLAMRAEKVLAGLDDLKRLATPDSTAGEIAIGFVPTTLQTLLPVVLARMQKRFPALTLRISSGLSGDLASQVRNGRLTYAVLTEPARSVPDLSFTAIAKEPLYVIAPAGTALPRPPIETFRMLPYIGFARSTWLGRDIDALLRPHGISATIELDSIDAVENLVARGFGASIVPQRLHAPALGTRMACAPIRGTARQLMLASHISDDRATVREALAESAAGADETRDGETPERGGAGGGT